MSEPIDALAEPKKRTCRRLSVYFVNGQAQDFNLYEGDEFNPCPGVITRKDGSTETIPLPPRPEPGPNDRLVITRKDGTLTEVILYRNVAWYRLQTLEVAVPKKRESPRADL